MEQRIITAALLRAFEHHLLEEEKSPATIEKYMRDLCRFRAFSAERPVGKALVLEYKRMLEQQYAPRSVNSVLGAINTFLRFVHWEELRVKQLRLQKQAYCPDEKELTREEYSALVQAAGKQKNQRLALIIQTICACGIRVSEMRFITVEAAAKGEAVVSCKGKIRKIFLVSQLRKKLLAYAKQQGICSGCIFVTRNGRPVDRSNVWREMKALCAGAGVSPSKVFPHNLRHLFARIFYGLEKDIAKLADVLGHSNINTTRIYIITTGAEHRQKMERMRLII